MPVTRDHPAPYAPASAILGLIERHRNKGLPSPVDSDVLGRAGISASLIPRTLQALQTLDLLDEEGKPSKTLEDIRLAPEVDYKTRLADWLNNAYADALMFVDPSKDGEIQIRDAFRSYKPVGQQSRMVTLFIGLFTGAGVMPEKAKQPSTKARTSLPATKTARVPAALPKQVAQEQSRSNVPSNTLPPAIAGLLASLPPNGSTWTKAERDRFVLTFGAVIDFCFPVDTGRQKPKHLEEEDREP